MGEEISPKQVSINHRGRVGLLLVMCGFLFLDIGSKGIIYKPTEDEAAIIHNRRKVGKQMEKIELSIDSEEHENDSFFDKEENTNIRAALDWKRHHFFVANLIVTIFLMLKFEYSYTKMFAANITTFLILFVVLDIFIE